MTKKIFTGLLIFNFIFSSIIPSPLMADPQPLLSNQNQQFTKPADTSSSTPSLTQSIPSGSLADSGPLSKRDNSNPDQNNSQVPAITNLNDSPDFGIPPDRVFIPTDLTAKTGNTNSQTAGSIKAIGNSGDVVVWGLKKMANGIDQSVVAVVNPFGNEKVIALPEKVNAGNVSIDPDKNFAAFIYQTKLSDGSIQYKTLVYNAQTQNTLEFDPNPTANDENEQTTVPIATAVDSRGYTYILSATTDLSGLILQHTLTVYDPTGNQSASEDFNQSNLEMGFDATGYARLDISSDLGNPIILRAYGISHTTGNLVIHTFQVVNNGNFSMIRDQHASFVNVFGADTALLRDDDNFLVMDKPNADDSGTHARIVSGIRVISDKIISGAPTDPRLGHITISDPYETGPNKHQYTFTQAADGTQLVTVEDSSGQNFVANGSYILRNMLGKNDGFVIRGATFARSNSIFMGSQTEKMVLSVDHYTTVGDVTKVERLIVKLSNPLQRFMENQAATVSLSNFSATAGNYVINDEPNYSVLYANVNVQGLVPGGVVFLDYKSPNSSRIYEVAMNPSAADPNTYEVYVPGLDQGSTYTTQIVARNPHEVPVKTPPQDVYIPFAPPAVSFTGITTLNRLYHQGDYQITVKGFDSSKYDAFVIVGNNSNSVTPDANGIISFTVTGLYPGQSVLVKTRIALKADSTRFKDSASIYLNTLTLGSMVSGINFTSTANDTPGLTTGTFSFKVTQNPADPVNFGAKVALYQIDGTTATLVGTYEMDCATTAGTCNVAFSNLKQMQSYRLDATLKDLDHQPQAQQALASQYVTTQHGRLIISIESDTETSNSASLKGTIAGINLKTDDAYVFYRVKDTSAWQSTLISIIDPNNGKFNAVINGLNPSTPYEYKIVVTVKGNINQHLADSPIKFFTTTAELKIKNVQATSGREFATIGGKIEGLNTTLGQKAALTLIDAYDFANGRRTFDLAVTNNLFQISVPVRTGGAYYYQIKVTDGKTEFTSTDLAFFQVPAAPVLTSLKYADAVDTVIDYYGKIDGLLPTDNVALLISTSQQILIHNLTPSEMVANGNVAVTVTGLTRNTTYALRLRVTDTVSPSKRTYDLPEIQYVSTTSGPNTALIDAIKKIYSFSDGGTVAWRNDDPTHTPIFGRSLDATKTLYYARSINSLYQIYLGRSADPAGLNDKLSRLLAENMTLAHVGREILNSPEFRNNLAGIQNYVNQIGYRNILNREGDPGGLAYWARLLQSGLRSGLSIDQATASLQNGFMNSVEYQNRLAAIRNLVSPAYRNQVMAANVNFLTGLYRNLLGRAPDDNREIAKIWFANPLGPQQDITQTFLQSSEFRGNLNKILDNFVGKLTDPAKLIVPGSALRNIYWGALANDVAQGKFIIDIFTSKNIFSYFLENSRNSLPQAYKISNALNYLIPIVFLPTNRSNPQTTVVQGFRNENYVPGDTATAQFSSTDADKGDTVTLSYQLFRREGENGARTLVASGALTNGNFSYTLPDSDYAKLFVYDLVVFAKSTQNTGGQLPGGFGGQRNTYLQFRVGPPYNINHMPKGFKPDFNPAAANYFAYRLDSNGNNAYTLTLLELSTGKTTVFSITSNSTPVYYGITTNRNAVVFTRTAPTPDPWSDPYPTKIDVVSLKYPQDQDPQEMVEWRFHAPSGIKVDFSQPNRVVVTNIRMGTEIVTVDVSNIKQLNVVWNGWLTKNRSNDTLNGAWSPDPPFYAYKIDQSSGQDILSTRFLPTGEIITLEQAALNSITFIGVTAAKNTGFTPEGFAVWTTRSSSGVSVSVDYIGQGNRSPAQYVRIDGAPSNPIIDAFNGKDAIYIDNPDGPYFRVISFTRFPGQYNPQLFAVPADVSAQVIGFASLNTVIRTPFRWDIENTIPQGGKLEDNWIVTSTDSYPPRISISVRKMQVTASPMPPMTVNIGYKVAVAGLYDPTSGRSSSNVFYYNMDGSLQRVLVVSSSIPGLIGGANVFLDEHEHSWKIKLPDGRTITIPSVNDKTLLIDVLFRILGMRF